MNNEEVLAKIRNLMSELTLYVLNRSDFYLRCGGVDTKSFQSDSYVLPKLILALVLREYADRCMPKQTNCKRIYNNLKKF